MDLLMNPPLSPACVQCVPQCWCQGGPARGHAQDDGRMEGARAEQQVTLTFQLHHMDRERGIHVDVP